MISTMSRVVSEILIPAAIVTFVLGSVVVIVATYVSRHGSLLASSDESTERRHVKTGRKIVLVAMGVSVGSWGALDQLPSFASWSFAISTTLCFFVATGFIALAVLRYIQVREFWLVREIVWLAVALAWSIAMFIWKLLS